MGMTDPKEAAVQRLAVEFLKHEEKEYGVVYPGSAMYDSILAFARIAIEHGVVPVAGNIHHPKAIHGYLGCSACESGSTIPWDAVCPADAPGEKP